MTHPVERRAPLPKVGNRHDRMRIYYERPEWVFECECGYRATYPDEFAAHFFALNHGGRLNTKELSR